MKAGPRNLITDIAGIRVGNAQDHSLKSGVTVLTCDAPLTASVHVMGGAPGTRETDLLAPDKTVPAIDALVLSGGSAFGLDACSGVMDALLEDGRGFAVGPARVPIVPGAILFDLVNGGEKTWSENPYRALGKDAYRNAQGDFQIGSHGAGTGAMTARLKGGLGSASSVLPDGTIVGALVAANPVGSTNCDADRHFWAAPFERNGEFGGLGPCPACGATGLTRSRKMELIAAQGANTTIAIVATDAALDKSQYHRLAVAAHDGIARAIVPAHTPHDGDLVFSIATGEKPTGDPVAIGAVAAQCLSRAIARAIFAATAAEGDLLPAWKSVLTDSD